MALIPLSLGLCVKAVGKRRQRWKSTLLAQLAHVDTPEPWEAQRGSEELGKTKWNGPASTPNEPNPSRSRRREHQQTAANTHYPFPTPLLA
jgi:hypothetical protein